jgi:hypothetical protein
VWSQVIVVVMPRFDGLARLGHRLLQFRISHIKIVFPFLAVK